MIERCNDSNWKKLILQKSVKLVKIFTKCTTSKKKIPIRKMFIFLKGCIANLILFNYFGNDELNRCFVLWQIHLF